jgi:hypothetical protein
MRRFIFLYALFSGLAGAALGEPMSAAEFEAYVTGRTILYGRDGSHYGGERYLEGREVEWSRADGTCSYGFWYPAGDYICFEYEDVETAQCWIFEETATGLSATYVQEDPKSPLLEYQNLVGPLGCIGPKVGV